MWPRTQDPLPWNVNTQGEPGIFSHMSMEKGQDFQNRKAMFCTRSTNHIFNAPCVGCLSPCGESPTIPWPFWAFRYTHAQLRYLSTPFPPLTLLLWEKIPGSPRLHNFNVRILERGSLGSRLMICTWSMHSATHTILQLNAFSFQHLCYYYPPVMKQKGISLMSDLPSHMGKRSNDAKLIEILELAQETQSYH